MPDRNSSKNTNGFVNKNRGMQGIDKAPGEENARTTENPVPETQKAKGKVDGDPSRPEDQPADES